MRRKGLALLLVDQTAQRQGVGLFADVPVRCPGELAETRLLELRFELPDVLVAAAERRCARAALCERTVQQRRRLAARTTRLMPVCRR